MIPLRLPASPLGSALSLLLTAYGRQGWWPLPSRAGKPGFDGGGYHPGRYDWPRGRAERFEVVLGAALTQNTAWLNAEKALQRLLGARVRLPVDILGLSQKDLAALIRPAGYFNQKAKKLRELASFFAEPRSLDRAPAREELLSIWGVGPETADSILLYAFRVPIFVVDAYTRRFLERAGLSPSRPGARLPPWGLSPSRPGARLPPWGLSPSRPGARATYEDIQALFHKELPAQHELFNECHALIVAHCKGHCRKKPVCAGCPVIQCPRVGVGQ